jgi:riboflavin kinase/FMN adenylyltransferase
MRAAQARRATSIVITFEPHPLAILSPQRAPARLTTLAERLTLLEGAKAHAAVILRSEPALLSLGAAEFVDRLARFVGPRVLVEGPTFNFGRGRAGSIDTLRELAPRYGYEVHAVGEVHCDALAGRPAINSSAIRAALSEGRVEDSRLMLGRPHRIVGEVRGGQQRGVQLGFPTANVEAILHMLPAHAVYAAIAQRADGALSLAAVNIGPQPTFAQQEARVEAHLLDFDGDLRGQRLGLHLLSRLRGQTRFDSVASLAAQLRVDVERVRASSGELAKLRATGVLSL